MTYSTLIKSIALATVIAFTGQAAVGGGSTVDMRATDIIDGGNYVSEGAFLTLLFIEEFEEDMQEFTTAPTTTNRKEATDISSDVEEATTLIDTPLVPCEFCGVICRDWNARYDHDIFVHGYCEEHSEYEDCYNEDGSLKDCYHLTVDSAVKHR